MILNVRILVGEEHQQGYEERAKNTNKGTNQAVKLKSWLLFIIRVKAGKVVLKD